MTNATKWCLLSSHARTVYEVAIWRSDTILRRLVKRVLKNWFRKNMLALAGFDHDKIIADFEKTTIATVRQALLDAGWSYCGYNDGLYKLVDLRGCQRLLNSLSV